MVKEVLLPDLGEGIEGAEVSEVLVGPGESVSDGDTLLVLESDKASMEIPSDYSGEILEVLISTGEEVKTGSPLIRIDVKEDVIVTKEDIDVNENKETQISKKPKEPKKSEDKRSSALNNLTNVEHQSGSSDHVFATPGVRRLARELKIELHSISGSGPKGRITKDDLNGYIQFKMNLSSGKIPTIKREIDFSQWGDIETQKLTRVNKITGNRLQEAWNEIPHVTQLDKADITELDLLRKKLKKDAIKEGINVTFLPFLMKSAVAVLKEMPRFNSSLSHDEQSLILKNYYNLGVAVDTPAGLIVPSIKNVDKKTILELSEELMDISKRAREKKLKPSELTGSTFTISSLGGIGGSYFSPIINPPEVAILGVSRASWEATYNKSQNNFVPRYMLPLSLSYDHRVIDGAAGAAFTNKLGTVMCDLSNFQN